MPKFNYDEKSTVKKSVEIIYSKEEINKKLQEIYNDLKNDVQIKGFRKGKAPLNIIKKRFGERVKEDLREQLFQEGYGKVIEEKNWHILKVVNADIGELSEDNDFVIKLDLEIRPKNDNVKYKDIGLDTNKKQEEASEEEITKVLKNIQRDKAFISPVKDDRPVQKGDMVTVDLQVEKIDNPGEYMTLYENLDLIIDDDTPYDKGIKDSTIGKKKGDEYEYVQKVDKTKTPEEERDEIKYKITIKDIKEMELPELDDELAKQIEFENIDTLKNYIKELIESDKINKFREEQKEEILKLLLEANPVEELPEEFVKDAVEDEIKKAKIDKLPEDKKEERIKEIRKEVEKNLKEMMVVLDIANKENLEVSDQEVDLFFQHFAPSQGIDPQQLKQIYEQNGLINKIKSDILINKVVDFVRSLHEPEEEKENNNEETKEIENSEEGDKELPDTDGSGADQ